MATPTQRFLEIDQIREGVVVLRNKALRGIIMVSSLNFALKSEEEQNSIIFQFQSFLNSLDFSLQVMIQSRKLNITGYLDQLKDLEVKEQNELLKLQIGEYQKFIRELITGSSIMAKNFFVIVPFTLAELPRLSTGEKEQRKSKKSFTEEKFQRAKTQLWQRMEFVTIGLRRCGLQCVPLNTTELIELYWGVYHPEESEIGYYPEIPPEMIS